MNRPNYRLLRAIKAVRELVEVQGVPWPKAVDQVIVKHPLGLTEMGRLRDEARKKYEV